MMTEGKQADSSPRNQPQKSFWDRNGATGSPSWTRTNNLAVNSRILIFYLGNSKIRVSVDLVS